MLHNIHRIGRDAMFRFRKMFAIIFAKFRTQSAEKKMTERAPVTTDSTSESVPSKYGRPYTKG